MAKAGPYRGETKRCTFANEPQHLNLCRMRALPFNRLDHPDTTSLVSGCGQLPAPFWYSNFPSTSLPGLIPLEDHLFLFCWREGNWIYRFLKHARVCKKAKGVIETNSCVSFPSFYFPARSRRRRTITIISLQSGGRQEAILWFKSSHWQTKSTLRASLAATHTFVCSLGISLHGWIKPTF